MDSTSAKPSAEKSEGTFWGALEEIVKTLTQAIERLPHPVRFGAFFLVIGLVATVVTTLSLDSDNHKLGLIISFLFGLSLFVIVIYAFNLLQSRTERKGRNAIEEAERARRAERELQDSLRALETEIDNRVNRLEEIHKGLKGMQHNLEAMPPGSENDFLKNQVRALLDSIELDLDEFSQDRLELSTAQEIEEALKDPKTFSGMVGNDYVFPA